MTIVKMILVLVVFVGLVQKASMFLVQPNTKTSPPSSIKDFTRVIGSIDSNETVVTYLNGSIYGRLNTGPLQMLFLFEGYNINRKVPLPDGSYQSLSREFVVYRDIHTRKIKTVFENPFNNLTNEVFPVANDPVNAKLTKNGDYSSFFIPNELAVYDNNYILEYPNVLDPKIYPEYSAGKIYDAAELFTYFANMTDINNASKPNVPNTVTWSRHCQFLPWMEMGPTKGSLFYSALSWKCLNGLSCVPKDIINIVSTKYKTFLKAPKTFDDPNETSWSVFKKIIDNRRHNKLPDIIIPQVNVSVNVSIVEPYVDNRILRCLYRSNFRVNFNASILTQIYGQQSINLLNLKGQANITTSRVTSNSEAQMQVSTNGLFIDSKTKMPISIWYNPFTNKTVDVPILNLTETWNLTKDTSYSINMKDIDSIGLSVVSEQYSNAKTNQNWCVSVTNFIFREVELQKTKSKLFGSFHRYSNWFKWMEMGEQEGTLVVKAIFSTE
ncbi:uncharacterized protein LOC134704927 [Mytilus trossulus]|uniref:uncharacterized protein LOC134704927 n=1 Tax=Mytilus trossulus TaxID=6551 RepID=UPI0030050298